MTTEAGGFTLNGEAFEGGAENPVEGEGGRMYALTLADGAWTAAFVPMEVTVALGNSEESVTLTTVEAGGYTMGGEAFASGGTATSSAGAEYTLTMGEDGTWTAMFAPMTRSVPLGNSGMSVELVSNEAGMWTVGGAALAGDGTDTYMSGNRTYSLAMEDGAWTAAFVPMTQDVTLGNSGDTVTLMTVESGGWAIGDSSVADGYMTTAANDNRYTLAMGADGRWMATFQPASVAVMLGGSGEFATLMTEEDGSFTMDGAAVVSGSTTAMNSANESYTLSRGDDGMWTAMHMPSSQSVDLGASGMSVTLMTNEAGAWTMDGDVVDTGATVPGGANAATGAANMYTLTLDPDTGDWSAAYDAMAMDIAGTGLQAMAREDGSGYDVGDTMSLDADGTGEITGPDGGMFRVMMDEDGMLAGTRYAMDMANTAMTADAKEATAGTANAAPKLIGDNRDTPVNEKNTRLSALGETFSIGELLGGGAATETGANIVAKARADIVKIRDRVAQLVALRADAGISDTAFDAQILIQWGKADDAVTDIFGGPAAGRLERTTSESRVVDAFDRLVDALSSEEAFAAATLANGPDKLQGFDNRNATQARDAFNRLKSTATARLASSGSTRFGVAVFNFTPNAKNPYNDAESAQAFAWSTMDNIRRASDMRASGSATYAGQTMAADQAGNIYSGSIDIDVRLTRMSVDGFVTALARADTQAPWTHGLGGEVTGIHFPTATLNTRGRWTVTGNENNSGRIAYNPQAGGQPDLELNEGATFAGQLLGRGDQSGEEAIGTWKIVQGSTTLAGAFGATRGDDRAAPGAAFTGDLAAIGKRGDDTSSMETGPALIAAREAAEGPPAVEARPKIPASTVLDTTNANFKYVPRPRDSAAEAATADSDEYVVGNYTVNRATVLEADEHDATKGNWVADARKEIVKKLNQLQRVIALDNADASAGDKKFANDQRQRMFNDIQAELANVFGTGRAGVAAVAESSPGAGDGVAAVDEIYTGVLTREDGAALGATDAWTDHTDYPVNSAGVAQDASVIAEIEDVLEALGDADAFADALASGGLFADAKDSRIDPYPGAAAIFGRARGRLRMATAATDYTRLGAWRHQVSRHAADSLALQTYERADPDRVELGAFAYSPLAPTAAYSSASHRLYPAAGANRVVSATYAGRTAAAQGDIFYTGEVEARVFWDPSKVTDSQVTVTLSDLQDADSGDPLQFGYVAPAGVDVDEDLAGAGVVDVESLMWTAPITNTGVVKFESDDEVTVGVNSVSGRPIYRPVPGSAFIDGMNFKRFERSGMGDHLRYGTSATNYNAAVTAGADYGMLSFDGTGTQDTEAATITRTGTPYETAKDAFEAGQVSLAYPMYMIKGPRIEAVGGSINRDSLIFLYADGSTRHADGWADFNQNAYFIDTPDSDGDINIPASMRQLEHFAGNPLLSANDNRLLYNDLGQPWSKDFVTEDGNGNTIGDGAPEMTPAEIAAAWLRAGGYVNILATDATARASDIKGMFVGQDQDGPLGIIGTWELTGGAFGVGTERGVIRGAFGADVQP